MNNTLNEALRPQFTVDITGYTSGDKKLCLLPGIYSTMKEYTDGTSKATILSFNDPTNLNNAGYSCEQVADEYNSGLTSSEGQYIQVRGVGRNKYRDFLNTIQRVGARVMQIVIQNKVSDTAIFDQQIEVARTILGAKGGMDFINLQQYVNVNAFDRSKITIDMSAQPLELTPETYLAINVPDDSHFSIQFVFEY